MANNIFGNRLKQAREAAGLSLRALAEKIGLSHTAIQKYEKGEVFPSSNCLVKLSKAIKVSVDYLFRSQEIELGALSFRKKSSLGVKAIRRIEFQIRDKLEQRLELENCYPIPPIKSFKTSHISNFKINDYNDVEDVVIKIRNSWKLGLAPIHDLINVFENNGIRVIEVDTDEKKFDGLFLSIRDEPIIVINKQWAGDRQRFTLTHELGHLFLEELPANLDEERACNRFSGSFLFPKQSVIQKFSKNRSSIELRELLLTKQEYGLSMYAILFRLFQLKIIKEVLFNSWKIRISKEGWRKKEPGDQLPSEKAHVFEQMVFHAFGEDYISESKAARFLKMSIDSFRRFRLINEKCSSG